MSFTPLTAQKLRIPLPVVECATTSLLQLLRRNGEPADVQRLLQPWTEAVELLERHRSAADQQGLLARIGNFIFAMPSTQRNAKTSLLVAGLTESELVPFVAAFVAEARTHVDDATLARLVVRVPGLTRLCRWPLAEAPAIVRALATTPGVDDVG
jgi:hypothetical protein